MSVFEITVQHQTRDGYPIVAEFTQADRLVVRVEQRLLLSDDLIIDLRACDEPAEYGRWLGEAVFQRGLRDAFMRARATSADRMHLLLCIEPPELRTLHWERMLAPMDDGRWDFLALDQRVPLSIYTPSSTDRRFLAFGAKELRALLVVANPSQLGDYGLAPFDEAESLRRMAEVFGRIPFGVLASTETLPQRLGSATLDRLCEALTGQRYTLLHIICHGQLRADGETILYLEDDAGKARPVPAAQLIGRLSRLRGAFGLPHFVFLAACESAHPSAEKALGGLGQRLVRELGMPAVVAMSSRVSWDLAMALAQRFYPRLCAHGAVDVALVEANAGLAEHEDVLVPALYSRLGDRPLWSARSDASPLSLAEVRHGCQRLVRLLRDRAPTLLPELDQTMRTLQQIEKDAFAIDEPAIPQAAMLSLEELCSEALDRTFRHIALDHPVPDYDSRCPFPGLGSFRSEERAFFFGREKLTLQMVERLESKQFLAVLGHSGCGKSSVVLAGVVPEIQRRHPGIPVATFSPGPEPLLRLEHVIRELLISGHSLSERSEQTRSQRTWSAFLVINQFEEVFALCPDIKERTLFLDRLLDLIPRVTVCITMRADFFGECAEHPRLKELMMGSQELVGSLTPHELRRAIEQQVAAVGLRMEDGLCATMLAEVEDEPGAMPLLQHALLELWKRRRGVWLRAAEYRSFGGVQMAIAETAECVYQQIGSHEEEQQRMRDILTRLTQLDVTPIAGRRPRDSRRSIPLSDLIPAGPQHEATRRMINRLVDARLIVTRHDLVRGDLDVEVAHEAVIRHWPRLRTWLDEDRLAIGFREGVRQAAKEWVASDRNDSLLLHRGERLRLVRESSRSNRYPFNQEEQGYVDACAAAEEATRKQQEEQLKREQEHAKELALALDRALHAAKIAQSRQLAMQAASVLEKEPQVALLLAREAAHIAPTAEALTQLQCVLNRPLAQRVLQGHKEAVLSVCFRPDGGQILSASVDRTARLWTMDGQLVAVLLGHQDAILAAQFCPDGERCLTVSSDKSARIWMTDGTPVAELRARQGVICGATYSPDGSFLVTCSSDGAVRIWNADGSLRSMCEGHQDAVGGVSVSRDSRHILTVSKDRTARLWSKDGSLLSVLRGHGASLTCGCFSSDGQQILTTSWDGTARLWSIEGRMIAMLRGHTDRVITGCFGPHGKLVVTASRDQSARLWDENGQPLAVLRGHTQGIHEVCFNRDGNRILTSSSDCTARLWDSSGQPLATFLGHEKKITSSAFSPDGRQIATCSWDGTVRLWPAQGSCQLVLHGHQSGITFCALSADQQSLLTCAEDGSARTWTLDGRTISVVEPRRESSRGAVCSKDGSLVLSFARERSAELTVRTRTGQSARTFASQSEWVVAGDISPDNRWVVTAGIDGSARLWRASEDTSVVLKHGHAALSGARFSPQGDRLLTASSDGTVRVWDLQGTTLSVLRGHADAISCARFHPDGQRILTTSWDGTAALWTMDGNRLCTLEGHGAALLHGEFNRSGSLLLTVSRDCTARLWTPDGTCTSVLRGHRDWVTYACFGDHSDLLLTVSRDATARLWRTDGSYVMSLRGHRDWVTYGCFLEKDQYVMTASADHTARIWPANRDVLFQDAARYVLRGFLPSEREAYLDFAQTSTPTATRPMSA